MEIMEHSGGKIRYDRFEKPAKNLFMKFYDKKYSDDYKGINTALIVLITMMKVVKIMIKKLNQMKLIKLKNFLKLIFIFILKMKKSTPKLTEETAANMIKIFIY